MKLGMGNWKQIIDEGYCPPNRDVQSMIKKVQRITRQQSLNEFTGLKVNITRIGLSNCKKKNVTRTRGLIIAQASNVTKEEKLAAIEANKVKFKLTTNEEKALEKYALVTFEKIISDTEIKMELIKEDQKNHGNFALASHKLMLLE